MNERKNPERIMLRATIAEPIPSLNKGEAAILRGLQEALAVCRITDITLYSPPDWNQDDSQRYKDVKIVSGLDLWDAANNFLPKPVPRGRFHFLRTEGKLLLFSIVARLSRKIAYQIIRDDFLKSLADADLIVAGHDGMLGYGHFWIVLASRIMNKPIALYGGGNDFGGRSNKLRVRKFLQFIANHSILLSVRDTNTRDYFIKNDVDRARVRVFPDPAVLLKPCEEKRVIEMINREGIPLDPEKPLYGLIPVRGGIVADKSFSYEKNKDKKHDLRVGLWMEILTHLLNTTNAHFVFIPHCIGPTQIFDDRRMMNDLFNALPEHRDRITMINREYSESEYKGLVKRCEFILGERTHALIGAVSVATPCIALTVEEDLRMHNIIKKMFKRPTFNLNAPDIESLKKVLTEEWNNRKDTAVEMRHEAEHVHKEAVKAAMLLKERIEQYYNR